MNDEDRGPVPPPKGHIGPAFPTDFSSGMSLRDYFAGQALVGLCANTRLASLGKPMDPTVTMGEFYAVAAYEFADAMVKARGGD